MPFALPFSIVSIICFCVVISFICSHCMGYLSSKDFAQASMNWIAEGVNVVGQGSFLLGAVMLHKAGLAEYKIPRKIVGESKYHQ